MIDSFRRQYLARPGLQRNLLAVGRSRIAGSVIKTIGPACRLLICALCLVRYMYNGSYNFAER